MIAQANSEKILKMVGADEKETYGMLIPVGKPHPQYKAECELVHLIALTSLVLPKKSITSKLVWV